jgi:NAD(P)-dependent dehydrogenase (short-subunit alcohol dehydrogenase family)
MTASVERVVLPKTPSSRLDGRRALVTGGGRGIGLACAAALAEAGAHVCVAARSLAEVEAVANAIKSSGGAASALALDVTDLAALGPTLEKLQRFDILVNSAGGNRPSPFVEVRPEDFDQIMSVNARAVFFVAQAVVRRLIAEGAPGSIINISSQMGLVGAARRTTYCASKHAVEGMTKAMAVELGRHNIRVNSLCPTFIETPMTRPFFEDSAFKAEVLGKIKLGRVGQVCDLMAAVVYLASDAAAMTTGSALVVDGGWTAD